MQEEERGGLLQRVGNAADHPRQGLHLRGRLQDADQGHRRHLQGQVPFLLVRQATTSNDSLKTPIRRVDTYLVDLIPERPRTDAIQSFTKQETIFVNIETSNGVFATGSASPIAPSRGTPFETLPTHLAP